MCVPHFQKSRAQCVLGFVCCPLFAGKNPNFQAFSSLGFPQQMDNEFICGEDDGCVGDLSN